MTYMNLRWYDCLTSIYQGNEAEISQNENKGNMIRSAFLFKCGKADCFRSFP